MKPFDNAFFRRHQKTLLWLLNTPGLRTWFRWLLRIEYQGKIEAISPNAIWYDWDGQLEVTAEFRGYDKYAKRLYHAFKPFWYLLHVWDTAVANKLVPQWNAGFDSITVYPAAGQNSPVDGHVYRSVGSPGEGWTTLTAGAGNGVSDTDTNLYAYAQATSTSNQFDVIFRSIMCFNTSAIGSGSTVTAAVLSLYDASNRNNGLGSDDIHICASTPTSDSILSATDYSRLGSTSFASIGYASISVGAYNDFTLSASGRANVSKTGVSRFGLRLGWDITNSFTGVWASNAATYNLFRSADYGSDTTFDPKLVVTYTAGAADPSRPGMMVFFH